MGIITLPVQPGAWPCCVGAFRHLRLFLNPTGWSHESHLQGPAASQAAPTTSILCGDRNQTDFSDPRICFHS